MQCNEMKWNDLTWQNTEESLHKPSAKAFKTIDLVLPLQAILGSDIPVISNSKVGKILVHLVQG
jgi:hypothetical protein